MDRVGAVVAAAIEDRDVVDEGPVALPAVLEVEADVPTLAGPNAG
jgi:hypothetical protein